MEYYYSIGDLPLDEWDGHDEDNSIHSTRSKVQTFSPADVEREIRALPSAATASAPKAIYVPHKRDVKLGTVGKDSLAVKRALSKAGFGKWGGWGSKQYLFGPYAVKHLKGFQKKKSLKVDGVYGLSTHAKLAPYFDAYGRSLMGEVKIISTNEQKRNLIVNAAMVGYQNRYSIHYTQSPLRMWGVRYHVMPPNFPHYEDCSSFSTWCYWVAKAADPNGLNYNLEGYTGTLINHGTRLLDWSKKRPGDLVFYGWSRGIPTHVAIYVGNGRVVSHGSESGPLLLNFNYRGITSIHSYLS